MAFGVSCLWENGLGMDGWMDGWMDGGKIELVGP